MGNQSTADLGDIDQDSAEIYTGSMIETHEALIADGAANSETAANIVRLSAARKFNREDPLEAAAAEVVLRNATP